uniref:Uncharacterized protein n=1 Tax=Rhizophora mucronata TaxID=61149 RepID=A0A2P2NLW0_RHIMU
MGSLESSFNCVFLHQKPSLLLSMKGTNKFI